LAKKWVNSSKARVIEYVEGFDSELTLQVLEDGNLSPKRDICLFNAKASGKITWCISGLA
jgi:hypothetical protein